MTAALRFVAIAMSLVATVSCQSTRDDLSAVTASPTAVSRETRLVTALSAHDTSTLDAPLAQWLLPPNLREISGLALTSDGRLLVHEDENGQVWEVDYRRGILVKRFTLGQHAVKDDFEGIAVVNDVVFLLASTGILYEFREGANGVHVDYTVHNTGLKKECEFEGIAFDRATSSLLLACKHVYDKALAGSLVIYRWSLLEADSSSRLSKLAFPLAGIIGANGWKGLHPSDISIEPVTGNYVLIASEEKAIISITPAGALVFARPLPGEHDQPEGVAITKDGILIVSDESRLRPALISLYRWH